MSIPEDMLAMADDLMATLGVSATYKSAGTGPDTPVTVRVKPERVVVQDGRKFRAVDISVRSSEILDPDYGDVFIIGPSSWVLRSLDEVSAINSHAMGALWQLTLTRDARPGRK